MYVCVRVWVGMRCPSEPCVCVCEVGVGRPSESCVARGATESCACRVCLHIYLLVVHRAQGNVRV